MIRDKDHDEAIQFFASSFKKDAMNSEGAAMQTKIEITYHDTTSVVAIGKKVVEGMRLLDLSVCLPGSITYEDRDTDVIIILKKARAKRK